LKRISRKTRDHSTSALPSEQEDSDLQTDAGDVLLVPPADETAEMAEDPGIDPQAEIAARILLEVAESPVVVVTGEASEPQPSTPEQQLPADGYGSDADLVERARKEPEAFGFLYERYVDRIYSYVYHRVGNQQDAEDLTARTFHRALDAMEGYEDRGLPFAAWLFRIAHNLVANWHRDRSRRRFLSLDRIWSQRSESDVPEGELERKETHDALWDAINRLPAERRDLLLYKFSGRMSNVEIGGLLKKSESAIKSLYFRTLAALRKDLEASGWGSDGTSRADAKAASVLSDDRTAVESLINSLESMPDHQEPAQSDARLSDQDDDAARSRPAGRQVLR